MSSSTHGIGGALYQQPSPQQAEQILNDPQAPPTQLAAVATYYPNLRPRVAAHPSAYPGLLEWLSSMGDPSVNSALANRAGSVEQTVPVQFGPVEQTVTVQSASWTPSLDDTTVRPVMPAAYPVTLGVPGTSIGPMGIPASATSAAPYASSYAKPVGAVGPHTSRRALWIGLGLGGVAAVVALVLLFTPLLSRLGFGKLSEQSPAADPAGATYLNGASLSWTLDLRREFPGQNLSFSFGPNLDDAWEWSRYGPLEFGRVWVAPYQVDDSSSHASGLLGIDRDTGKVLWNASGYQISTCAQELISGSLPCLTRSQSDHPSLALVDVSTGAVRELASLNSTWHLATAGDSILVLGSVGLTVASYRADGMLNWRKDLAGGPGGEAADLTDPLVVRGDYVAVMQMSGESVLRVSDGAVALRTTVGGELLPGGIFVGGDDLVVTVPAAAGLQVKMVSGRPNLVESNGKLVLFTQGNISESPMQWCPDQDPSKCQAVPDTKGWGLQWVVSVNGQPRDLVGGYSGDLASVDLVSGAHVADLTSYSESFWVSPLADGQTFVAADAGTVRLINTSTGAEIGRANLPGWTPLEFMTKDRLVLDYSTDGYAAATRIASFTPSTVPGSGLQVATTSANPTSPSGSNLPSCPSGTVQLAYATFPDGWVLVCGVNATTPTYWRSKDSAGELESSTVTYSSQAQRYTAQLTGGSAWLNHTPGVFGRADSGGSIQVQRSVGVIWFVALDGNSQSPSPAASTGPYGIPVPQATAADQVRYLSALLSSSASARAQLQPAVIAVRECARASGDYSAEVATISAVADNRSTLLDALATAPVDQVPDGTSLVSELEAGLQFSLQADKGYVEWATAVNDRGCGSGSEASARDNSTKAGAAKQIFVDHWNATIASSFGVAAVTRDGL